MVERGLSRGCVADGLALKMVLLCALVPLVPFRSAGRDGRMRFTPAPFGRGCLQRLLRLACVPAYHEWLFEQAKMGEGTQRCASTGVLIFLGGVDVG